jgi:hypothetical protein
MSRRRSTRGMVVPDSEDEAEIDVLESTSPSVFEAVVVNNAKKTRLSAPRIRDSTSSVQSADPSTRGGSPYYDTPATSAAVTPIESFSRPRRSIGAAVEFKLGGSSINASSKRKRASAASNLKVTAVVDTSKDEDLARQLQAHEYREPVAKKSRPTPKSINNKTNGKGRKAAPILDSDEDQEDFDDALSEADTSTSSEDVPLMKKTTRARLSQAGPSKRNYAPILCLARLY